MLDLVRARKLDPVVFKALLNVVPAFAPGTFVTLSDGRSCVAVGFDPTSPCRPPPTSSASSRPSPLS